jgi:hypothetical protein
MTTVEDPRDDPRWELVRAAARRPVPTPYGLLARVLNSVQGVRGRDRRSVSTVDNLGSESVQ